MAVDEPRHCEEIYTEAELIQNFGVERNAQTSCDLLRSVLKKSSKSSGVKNEVA